MKNETLRLLALDSFDIINEFDDLLIPSKWKGKLSNEDIFRINERYKKFCYLEPLLTKPGVSRKKLWNSFLFEDGSQVRQKLADEQKTFKTIANSFLQDKGLPSDENAISAISAGLLVLLRQNAVIFDRSAFSGKIEKYEGDVNDHPAFSLALKRMQRQDLEFKKFKQQVLRKSSSSISTLEDLLEELMEFLQGKNALVGVQQEDPEEEAEDEEVEEGCSEDELRSKLMAVLSKVKFKTSKGAKLAVEKIVNGLKDKSPGSIEDLKKIIKDQFDKPLRATTIDLFANAIVDCYDMQGTNKTEDIVDVTADASEIPTKNVQKNLETNLRLIDSYISQKHRAAGESTKTIIRKVLRIVVDFLHTKQTLLESATGQIDKKEIFNLPNDKDVKKHKIFSDTVNYAKTQSKNDNELKSLTDDAITELVRGFFLFLAQNEKLSESHSKKYSF